MPISRPHQPVLVLAALLMVVGLGGCGGSKPVATGPKAQKGIYTTGVDCADSGKLSYEACSEVMAQAVQKHEAEAPTYSELRFCEAKEGEGKCEYTANQKYRPKLLAFLITTSEPPQGIPLYAHPKNGDGFRDLAGAEYMHTNEELVFSEHAQTMYERQNKKRR